MEENLTGKNFGEWTVLYRAKNKGKQARWHCKCSCGIERDVAAGSLRHGLSKSCGHSKSRGNPKHGKRWTKLYMVWASLRGRCNNTRNKDYPNYGGRGIKCCHEWDDFPTFEEWALKSGYKQGLSIDRVDNNGNYCPQNCRWATAHEQRINQRPRSTRRRNSND